MAPAEVCPGNGPDETLNRHTGEKNNVCGIFGAVAIEPGAKGNLGIIRALAWANRERGTDSIGFFDSSGRMTKRASDPSEALRDKKLCAWLAESQQTSWFIAGHTRFATRGKVNRRNAHPFRYGRIIGSHNGVVSAPIKFQVDSEYLFWLLNKHRGDYQKALGDVSGYFALSWFDNEHFYLLDHNCELSWDVVDGVLYYSSNWTHLDSCTGGDCKTFKDGEVMRINQAGKLEHSKRDQLAVFKGKVGKYAGYHRYSTTSTGDWRGYGNSWSSHREEVDQFIHNGTEGENSVKDYDAEWRECWAEYCSQGEGTASNSDANTGMPDFDPNERYAG